MARAHGISGAGAFFASRHTNTLGNPTTWGTSGNGLDVKMWGGTASNYLLWDSSENKLVLSGAYAKMSIAAQADTAGSGVKISATYPGALRVFSDDGGANIGNSVRGVQSRLLLTVDQSSGSIRSLQGQLKMAAGVDVAAGIYTAVQGYVEMVGTHVVKTGSTFSCFDASAEIGTSLTIDSGGEFFGIHVETTGSGTITNNGTAAAIGITKASGAANWPVGLFIDSATVDIRLSGGPTIRSGTGNPNGSLTGTKGSIYLRADNSSHDDTVYCNTDGGTTWAAIVSA